MPSYVQVEDKHSHNFFVILLIVRRLSWQSCTYAVAMDSQFPFKTTSIIVCYGYIFSRVHVFRSCVAVGCFRGTNQCVGFFLIVLLIHRISSFCFLKVSRLCSCSYLYFSPLYCSLDCASTFLSFMFFVLQPFLLFSIFCSLCYSLNLWL